MPTVPLPPGVTGSQHLREKAMQVAHKLYGEITPAIQNRLDHELEIISRMGFATGADGKPTSPFAALRVAYPSPTYQAILDDAEAILKLPRHISMHPGGVVVFPGALTDLVPVMRSGGKGTIITQLDLDAVEALGLVKIDLPGIRGLAVLGDVAEFIQASQSDPFETALAVLDSTPGDDPDTAQKIETGATIGCFQIERPGMRATLREIHARSEDDI